MAKIENTTAYPTVTPAADDLLIGTDVNNSNETVTFKISDIVGAGGVAQDLQSVLTTGNTSTLSIVLTGAGGNVRCTDVYPVTVTAQGATGNAGQILSSTGTGIEWIDSPTVTCCSLNDVLTSSVGANIATTAMTLEGVALTVKNAGGTLAVESPATVDISGTTQFSSTTVNLIASTLSFDATSPINDSAGGVGTAGQFLTSQGPGAGVAWSSTLPTAANPTLQEVLTAGNIANGVGITFQGTSTTVFGANNGINSSGTNEFNGNNQYTATGNLVTTAAIAFGTNATLWAGASIGTAGQVLTATGTGVNWTTLSLAADTLQEVLDAGNTATQNITLTGFIRPTTIQDSAGGTGAAGQVLTSDGAGNLNWSAAGTGAVASVTAAAASASTGNAVTITPTTGAVVVTPHTFNGAANIGNVPSSAAVTQTTHFLRADGAWQVPAANEPHGMESFKFTVSDRSITAGNYYTLTAYNTGDTYNIYDFSTDLGASSPAVLAGTMTTINHVAGILFSNPGEGACSTGFTDIPVCQAQIQGISSVAGTVFLELWKTSLCTHPTTYTLAGTCEMTVLADRVGCGTVTWVSAALRTLAPGEAFFVTARTDYTNGSASFQLNLSLRW